MYLFFLQVYVDVPVLPSFPTRRSSDLHDHVARVGAEQPIDRLQGDALPHPRWTEQRHRFALAHLEAHAVQDHRSEEHTSELQSHSDLVCRLLLEKKKKEQETRLLSETD